MISSVPWYQSAQGLLIAAGIFTLVVTVVLVPTALAVTLSRNPSGRR